MRENTNDRVNQKVLKCFRYVKRRSDEGLTRKVYDCEVEGRMNTGRRCTRWLDGDQLFDFKFKAFLV